MPEDKKQRYYRIINAVWDFAKKHIEEPVSEEFWEKCTEDIKRRVNESSKADSELMKDMLNAIAAEIDRENRNDGKKNISKM